MMVMMMMNVIRWYLILDINECTSEDNRHDCHPNATCMNTNGTYTCTCNDGYTGNGFVCNSTYTMLIYLLGLI